ncbi:MAG: putative motility protein [Thermotogota bacterium]
MDSMQVSAMQSNMSTAQTGMKVSTAVAKKAMDTTEMMGNMLMENIESSKVDVSFAQDGNRGKFIDFRV